jgi:RimJ/RimL family protein N-acetyltransferase
MLKEAIDSSLDHLRPWMPWARFEPQTLDEKVELLRGFRSRFDADEDFAYGVFAADESRQIGGAGLHQRGGDGSLEIGYFLRTDATGQGLATEVTAVLARVAVEKCGVERVDVQVDPANERSLRVPRRLGFVEEATLRRRLEPKENGGPRRDSLLFTLLAEEVAASPCATYDYRAFDVLGRAI